PSIIRLTPGLDDDVMTRTPAVAAPYTMLIAATSLSACTNARPSSGMRFAMCSSASVWGVMGYPKYASQPARMAASANATLPFSSSRATAGPLGRRHRAVDGDGRLRADGGARLAARA